MERYKIKPIKWSKHQDANMFWARPSGFISLHIEENEYPDAITYSFNVKCFNGTLSIGETDTIKSAKELAELDYKRVVEQLLIPAQKDIDFPGNYAEIWAEKRLSSVSTLLSEDYKAGYKEGVDDFLTNHL